MPDKSTLVVGHVGFCCWLIDWYKIPANKIHFFYLFLRCSHCETLLVFLYCMCAHFFAYMKKKQRSQLLVTFVRAYAAQCNTTRDHYLLPLDVKLLGCAGVAKASAVESLQAAVPRGDIQQSNADDALLLVPGWEYADAG